MELVPPDVALPFEVTFDSPDLDVAMRVFNVSSGSPIQVGSPIPMTVAYGNTYFGRFTAVVDRAYVINLAVYTDNTYATLDDNYSQGSESIYAQTSGGGGSTQAVGEVVGYVENTGAIEGQVVC